MRRTISVWVHRFHALQTRQQVRTPTVRQLSDVPGHWPTAPSFREKLGVLWGVWRAVRVFGTDQVSIVAIYGVDE